HMTSLCVPGTGFVNPGWTGQPVGALVSAAIAARPEVVIVAAGHNDSHWSASMIDAAADKVISRLRSGLPSARLVIIGPIWPNGSPPARALLLRDHLRAKAHAVHALFVDPIADGWFAGANEAYIGADGIHPTDAGHRHMARIMIRRLASI
ncbi:MAG: SGNH/GDSL hydrolase family protein, partial [Chloroflexota bacterium]